MEEKKDSSMKAIIKNLDLFLAGVALTVLVFVTFFGVFMRYFLGSPFAWEEEIQLACFVWITFLGVGVAFRTGSHVAIEILVERMPAPMAKAVEMGGYVLSVFILAFVFYQSTVIVQAMATMGRATNILHIPYSIVYFVVPLGCILMIYHLSYMTWRKFKHPEEFEVKD